MIATTRLVLRNFEPDDVLSVHAYGADPLVTRFMSWGPNKLEDTVRFVETVVAESKEQPRQNFNLAVTLRESGELIGACGLDAAVPKAHFILGYCLAAPYWGVGYGTEAVRAMVDFGFGELGAHRILAHVFTGNLRSQALLKKLAFANVATLANHVHIRNEWHNEYEFARDA